MARERFEVAVHTYGSRGRWERPEHQWGRLNQKPLTRDAAIALAAAQPFHATVQFWMTAEKVYDNEKPPGPYGAKPVLPIAPAVEEAIQKEQVSRSVHDQFQRAGVALPKIVRFFETLDAGEGASCPHCGATGRYIHPFQVEDGRRLAAMSGCVKLFPVSPVAEEDLKLRKKAKEYAEKGWKLASWDQDMRDAIDDFYEARASEGDTMRRIRDAKARASTYRRSRGFR